MQNEKNDGNQGKKSAAVVIAPPKPANEQQRLEALRRLNILDTSDEDVFDGITRVAKKIFNVPIILVSLVDENRQWFKSCIGLSTRETKRDVAFCAYAILSGTVEPLVINDALEDPRFSNNPLVTGEPFIRFYAGAPLITKEGLPLGTFCVIDQQPRTISQEDIQSLKDCASVVVRTMEMRLASMEQAKHMEMQNFDLDLVAQDRMKLLNAVNFFSEAFVMWNASLQVVFVNDSFVTTTKIQKEEALQYRGIDFLLCEQTDSRSIHQFKTKLDAKQQISLEFVSAKKDGELYWIQLHIQPVFDRQNQLCNFYGTFTDITQRKVLEMEVAQLRGANGGLH